MEINFKFPNRKSLWHTKDMNVFSWKIPGYKYGCVRNRVFMTPQRRNMAELATIMQIMQICLN